MPRSDRIFDLIQTLRDGRLHRAAELAQAAGVTTRTIWRDMAMLATSGMPVEGERGVGYILRAPITLPPMLLTPAEMEALRLGLRLVAQGDDAAKAAAARSVAAKVATVSPAPRDGEDDIFTSRRSEPMRATPHLPLMRKAIRQSERLTLAMLSDEGREVQCDIRPLALDLRGEHWTLAAWKELPAGFVTIDVNRILDIVPRGERFRAEAGKRLANYRRWRAERLA